MAQRYVSKHLHHFVGRSLKNDQQKFELLLQIINSGWLTPPPHRHNEPYEIEFRPMKIFDQYELINPKVICFGDIPVNDLSLHMGKYGTFGISFKKEFLIANGAIPVSYIPRNAVHNFPCLDKPFVPTPGHPDPYEEHLDFVRQNSKQKALPLREMFNDWYERFYHVHKYVRGIDPEKLEEGPHKKLLEVMEPVILNFIPHVLSLFKTYDDTLEDSHENNYYMEREWRVLGSVKFELSDIERIFIPSSFGKPLREGLTNYFGEVFFSDSVYSPK